MTIEVKATALGYYGGTLVYPGTRFAITDDAAFAESWMERDSAKSTTKTAAPPPAPPAAPGGPVDIPVDWAAIHYSKRIALAKAISGMTDVTAEMATTIIQAEVDQRDAIARGLVQAPPAPPAAPAEPE